MFDVVVFDDGCVFGDDVVLCVIFFDECVVGVGICCGSVGGDVKEKVDVEVGCV